jgi:hypothetical protein
VTRGERHIEPFQASHVDAVRAFNRRLAAGGVAWRFPEHHVPDWLAPSGAARIYQEFLLLLDGKEVRGAYVLKHQDVSLRGELQRVGSFYLPLSEGTVDPAYALVATQLMRDALRREPLLYGLGMGGAEAQIARLLRALRWPMETVPFYFKVRHGSRVFREARYLRRSRLARAALDGAAAAGIATLLARAADWALTRRPVPGVRAEPAECAGDWLDEVWRRAAAGYSFVAVRDAITLDRVYALETPELPLLRVSRGARPIGYVVVQELQRSGPKYFGDLRVGMLVDGLAAPADADSVVALATQELEARGVDLLVSNQMHPAWRAALRHAGFVRGPSNFLFAASPPLAARLRALDPRWRELHVNRGDGDVPWPGDRMAPVEQGEEA